MKSMAFRPRTESFAAKCPVEAPKVADLTLSRAMTSSDVCHLSMPSLIKKWNDSFDVEQSPFPTSNLSLVQGLISQSEVDAREALRAQRHAQMQAVSDAFAGDSIERTFDDIKALGANRAKTEDIREDRMDDLREQFTDRPMAQEAEFEDIQDLEANRTEADKEDAEERRQQLRAEALASLSDVGLSGFYEEDAQKAAMMISASLTEAGDAYFKHNFTLGMNGKPSIGLAGRDPAAENLAMRGMGVAELTVEEKVGALQMQRMY